MDCEVKEYELLGCMNQKLIVELWYSHMVGSMLLQNVEGVMKIYIVFACYKTRGYNSSHTNKCVEVEHENKSLDYQ